MRMWEQPAQILPVRVRPVAGETVVSFAFRLADANALTHPTTLLRALGEPAGAPPTRSWIDKHDITLNPAALHRLETFTGIPAPRLRKVLPTLAHTTIRADPGRGKPMIRGHRSVQLREHCDECIARLPGHPRIRVRAKVAPQICRRHRRWVNTTPHRPHQVDLSNTAGIIRAHRRFDRLCSRTGDGDWTQGQLQHADYIVREWSRSRPNHVHKHLHARWDQRETAMQSVSGPETGLLVLPEAVALAEVLCDLEWRRHVAMVDTNTELARFYSRVGRQLGQSPNFGDRIAWTVYIDPLKSWVIQHRRNHQKTRDEFWRRVRTHYPFNPYMNQAIYPSIRHFK
ncbi:TniQ family protein [Rhodococcus koreensis]|uniref:TniQ family protein n=1 Tax=Rhodococcus koreensis TaxID=99653 RepID=UPI0019820585|nr:TniQ family protein [Rhodococcus koreensis]QSE84663.1 TniQ family protein [Rhodococcus koreensis]QSE87063.1 TniQ family protein [Rhodococcus koreensis]